MLLSVIKKKKGKKEMFVLWRRGGGYPETWIPKKLVAFLSESFEGGKTFVPKKMKFRTNEITMILINMNTFFRKRSEKEERQ